MKICILGPVTSKNHFGGVATFNEGLYSGFLEDGHETIIVTNVKNGNYSSVYYNKINFLLTKNKIVKMIREFNPDIVVSSMWYGTLNKKINKKIRDVKTIHYLHGFPTYRYSWIKRFALNNLLKRIRKNTDFFVSNSAFTSCINTEIYGITSDKTIHIGLKESFTDFKKISNEKNVNFLFVGRIVEEKRVDKICEVFTALSDKIDNIFLNIVGDGQKKAELEKKYQSNKIKFLGKKTRGETLEEYANADIFISLNPHEPFGLVYLEALLNKCKIICPNTGGQTEFLKDFKEVSMIDLNNIEEAVSKILKLIKVDPFLDSDLEKFFEYFNYKRVAKELIEIK